MKLLLAPFLMLCSRFNHPCQHTQSRSLCQKFPAILVFGDSMVDSGNNHYVTTVFRANHLTYGREFPGQVPTGSVEADRENFKDYIGRLKGIAGEAEAMNIVTGSLVVISAGTNDFGFNFYDVPTRRQQYTISGYQYFLQGRIKDSVKELYDLGLQNTIISGLPPVDGCLSIQITARFRHSHERKCLDDQNSDAQSFNQKLVNLLGELQGSLQGSKVVFTIVYEPSIDMINNPQKYGEAP
ncbi:hypothetical protein CJ030_MR8G010059 [Morella rubra]|uniref:GDSL esterase/lipase n=1 Tax=Morella rubra TaxID=262757 RepID=A0A6A1UP99_9ROSI|nr:hypothetical protein CJ030_MR8G010059 [Morella rubra]